MRSILFIFITVLLQIQTGSAQDISVAKTDSSATIDGDVYFIHTVESKQTLFSIASVYEVKLSRIAFDNPGVLDGLKLGQQLKILKSASGETKLTEAPEQKLELDGEYVLYTVPKQQTLYAISKEYNTTVSAILNANPELADGLKVGSVIRIPIPKLLVADKNTKVEMVGLPDIVKRKEPIIGKSQVVSNPNRAYEVVLALPLYLDLNDTTAAKRLVGQPETIYEKSEIGLQFYEGFLLAMDTLQALGYKVNLKVVDTENRPGKARKLVEQGAFKNADLIVGPLYAKVFAELEKYAHLNCIPIVSPTIKGNSIVTNNTYAFKAVPSDEAMISDLGRYVSASDSTKNLILHYGIGDEQNLLWRFRQGLETAGIKPASFPSYNIQKTGTDSIRSFLSLTRRNNLVILSNDQVKLSGLIRKISGWAEDVSIVVFAPPTWPQLKNLEIDHFDDLRVHLPTAFFVDYKQLEVQEFVKQFRTKFGGEPSTFAFRGYDLAMHFIKNLKGIEENGVEHMVSVQEHGLQSDFRWKQLPDGGFENIRSRVVDYTGLQLKLATD